MIYPFNMVIFHTSVSHYQRVSQRYGEAMQKSPRRPQNTSPKRQVSTKKIISSWTFQATFDWCPLASHHLFTKSVILLQTDLLIFFELHPICVWGFQPSRFMRVVRLTLLCLTNQIVWCGGRRLGSSKRMSHTCLVGILGHQLWSLVIASFWTWHLAYNWYFVCLDEPPYPLYYNKWTIISISL